MIYAQFSVEGHHLTIKLQVGGRRAGGPGIADRRLPCLSSWSGNYCRLTVVDTADNFADGGDGGWRIQKGVSTTHDYYPVLSYKSLFSDFGQNNIHQGLSDYFELTWVYCTNFPPTEISWYFEQQKDWYEYGNKKRSADY